MPFRHFAHFRRKAVCHLHENCEEDTDFCTKARYLYASAQSVSYSNDTFKGCWAQTFLSVWQIIAESCGGEQNTVANVETKNINLKKQDWVLLRTFKYYKTPSWATVLYSFMHLCSLLVDQRLHNIHALFYKPKPFPSFSVIVVRQLDRMSSIFSFKCTIWILLRDWRMELWQSESSPKKIEYWCLPSNCASFNFPIKQICHTHKSFPFILFLLLNVHYSESPRVQIWMCISVGLLM